MHAESLSGEGLCEKVCVLQVGRHMHDSKLSPSHTLPDKMVPNVDVLRVWGSARVSGQPKRPHVVLVHRRRAYMLPESKTPQTAHKDAKSFIPAAMAWDSVSEEENATVP